MRNFKYIFLLFIVLITSFFIGYMGYKIYDSKTEVGEVKEITENIVEPEKEVNSTTEKVSPNARIIMRTYYEKCGHCEEEEVEIPIEMVNCTQEEIENKYKDLELETFSSDKLEFLKKENGICNNHYILKEKNNEINIYKLNSNEEEIFYDKTSISKEYLSDIDLEKIKKGIVVYGKEELNSILEDYE